MDNVSSVNVCNSVKQAFHHLAGLQVREWFRLSLIVLNLKESLHLATRYQFHLEYDKFLVLEHAFERNDGRVVHSSHDIRLVFQDLLGPRRQLFFGNYLNSRFLFCNSVLDKQDDAKCSHTKEVSHAEHVSEAVELFSLYLSVSLKEVCCKSTIVVLYADLHHQAREITFWVL